MNPSHKSAKIHSALVSPRVRPLLALVFLLFALLAVNSAYLGTVTLAEYLNQASYQDYFYLLMFLLHLMLGLLLLPPFVAFGLLHMHRARKIRNRYAIRAGLALYSCGLLLLFSGILLTRFGFFEVNDPLYRTAAYWLHVVTPVLAAWLFVLHRLAGRRIRWGIGLRWAGLGAVFAGGMLSLHLLLREQPQDTATAAFFPALSRIQGADRIPARHLMDDAACAECHGDIAKQSEGSMHRLSSFNNPAYRFSIEEARELLGERDGNLDATRLCAACHDLVPLFDGRFTDSAFGASDPTAHIGISCAGCHAITGINSPRGNGDYRIADPPRYPFAFSDNGLLRTINRQLVKAKPAFHKKTWLKPVHRSAEFCSGCHKVHLPYELNHYKWLRGQDHYGSFLLSGVSGHRVDSFYYPRRAVTRCAECHMPFSPSDDPAGRDFSGTGVRGVHNHLFAAGNTGVPHLLGMDGKTQAARRAMLQGAARVDLFGIKEQGRIDGELTAPLRPRLPPLAPGQTYLLETVVRTLKLGHHLTQGTADSNELWLEISVRDGDRLIASSGALDPVSGAVDSWAYFLNAYLLDRDGNRVERRNAQDIVVPLYDHQIPPGAANVVHYRLNVPDDVQGPIGIEVKLNYRKFNTAFLRHVLGSTFQSNDLPIVTLGSDRITLPLGRSGTVAAQKSAIPQWQRWNDYGIGLLRGGGPGMGMGVGELRQAEAAFRQVESLGRGDGPLNLARVYLEEGRLRDAAGALGRAAGRDPVHQPWTIAWLSAKVDRELGNLEQAITTLEDIVETRFPGARLRNFDFSKDIRVLNLLGRSLYERARRERGESRKVRRMVLLQQSRKHFESVLSIDPEDVSAHYNLAWVHQELGDAQSAQQHRTLHAKYKPDDQAVERVVTLHRSRNPAADHAAAAVVIYELKPQPMQGSAIIP